MAYGCHIWYHRLTRHHWDKLRKLQRLGLLIALPSFPGSPTASLELISDTVPVEIFLEKTAVKTIVRTNPDRAERSYAAKCDHISWLRRKAHEAGIERDKVDRTKCHMLKRDFILESENTIPSGTAIDSSHLGQVNGILP